MPYLHAWSSRQIHCRRVADPKQLLISPLSITPTQTLSIATPPNILRQLTGILESGSIIIPAPTGVTLPKNVLMPAINTHLQDPVAALKLLFASLAKAFQSFNGGDEPADEPPNNIAEYVSSDNDVAPDDEVNESAIEDESFNDNDTNDVPRTLSNLMLQLVVVKTPPLMRTRPLTMTDRWIRTC